VTTTLGPDVPSVPIITPRGVRVRRAADMLSRGLIAYGLIGMLVALIGLGTLFWTGATVAGFNDRMTSESQELGATLRRAATALDNASDTARSFRTTLDATPPSVRQAAQTIRNLRPRLLGLQQQASSLNILGSQPLLGIGELFGQMATDLEGLDGQLDGIADQLGGNQEALETNARSLAGTATQLDEFADRIDDGLITESVGDMRTILGVVLAMLVVAIAVPAGGALAFGLWIRRELRRGLRRAPAVLIVER
jgi:hypothetical protein